MNSQDMTNLTLMFILVMLSTIGAHTCSMADSLGRISYQSPAVCR